MNPNALYYDLITAMANRVYGEAKAMAELMIEHVLKGGATPLGYPAALVVTYCNNVLLYY